MFKYWVCFSFIFFISEGNSFTFSSQDKNRKPVEIQADNGISCNQETHVCKAKGNVSITQGDVRLRASEVTAYLIKLDDNHQTLDKIEAQGGVTIEALDKPQKLTADHGIYYITQGEMAFYGSPVRLELEQFWVQAHHRLTFSEKSLTARAEGKAEVFKNGQKLESPILVATFQKNTEGKFMVKEVNAVQGGVLQTPQEVLMANHMNHDALNKKAEAQGDVKIIRQEGILIGDKAEVGLEGKEGRVTGNHRRVKLLLIGKE